MRDTAGKSATEGQANRNIFGDAGGRLARKLSAEGLDRPNDLPQMFHGETPQPGLFWPGPKPHLPVY